MNETGCAGIFSVLGALYRVGWIGDCFPLEFLQSDNPRLSCV